MMEKMGIGLLMLLGISIFSGTVTFLIWWFGQDTHKKLKNTIVWILLVILMLVLAYCMGHMYVDTFKK